MFTLGTPEGDAEQDHLAYASPGLLEFLALNRKMSNVSAEAVRDLVAAADAMAVAVASDMQKAGVGILAGCDGMVAGFCLHDELTLMVKGGMSAGARCRQPRSIRRDRLGSRKCTAPSRPASELTSCCSRPTHSMTLRT